MTWPAAAALTERVRIHRDPHPGRVATFAEEVRTGLGTRPMRLSPKWFYDDLGSALFDAITRLPEYYLTRIERDLLATYGGEILAAFQAPLELVELGSGSGAKTRVLIDAALARQPRLTYRPIDISADALADAAYALGAAYDRLEVEAYAGDYVPLLRGKRLALRDRALALFLGSNIGNFDPGDAQQLLGALAGALRRGDGLLVGYDLKKDPSILEAAYDDPTGVTRAFNMNLLGRINRELGGDFDPRGFRFRARWNAASGAVESFLISARAQRVRIPGADVHVDFVDGDAIHTESSHKFERDDLVALVEAAGFAHRATYTDAGARYALGVFTVR